MIKRERGGRKIIDTRNEAFYVGYRKDSRQRVGLMQMMKMMKRW